MRHLRPRCTILILVSLGIIFFVLFGFRINLPMQRQISQAQWDAQGIDSYRYRVQFGCFCSTGAAYITVVNDQVTRIQEDLTNPLVYPRPDPPKLKDISAMPDWYARSWSSGNFPADLSKYTVEGLFDFATQHPQPLIRFCTTADNVYEITYNKERGYVDSAIMTDCPSWDVGLCLMAPAIGDCSAGFHISEFEVLPTTE